MLISYETASKLIEAGRLLHIAGTEDLLKKLPKGKWIGGSTEYFMAKEGGKVSGDLLFVTDFSETKSVYEKFKIQSYDEKNISKVSVDAYENGFSILIVPLTARFIRNTRITPPDMKICLCVTLSDGSPELTLEKKDKHLWR